MDAKKRKDEAADKPAKINSLEDSRVILAEAGASL